MESYLNFLITVKVEADETVFVQQKEPTVCWKNKTKKLVIFAKEKNKLGVSRTNGKMIKKSSKKDIINLKASVKQAYWQDISK